MKDRTLFPPLKKLIESLDTPTVDSARMASLDKIADLLSSRKKGLDPLQIVFVCTHNSRRSQMSQLWAQALAYHYGVNTHCYSAGTEATAFHSNAIQTMIHCGFKISVGDGENPTCMVKMGQGLPTLHAFSKTIDDQSLPKTNFITIMTCSDADQNCPFIPGAIQRIPLPYEDPKAADGQDDVSAFYHNTALMIAREWKYIQAKVAQHA